MSARGALASAFFFLFFALARARDLTARDCRENRLRNNSVCLEHGRRDNDCCGCAFETGCAHGFERVTGDKCGARGAVTTCCYHPTLAKSPSPPPTVSPPLASQQLYFDQPAASALHEKFMLRRCVYVAIVLLVLLAPPAVIRLRRLRSTKLQPAVRGRGWLVVISLRSGYVMLTAAFLPTVFRAGGAEMGECYGTSCDRVAIMLAPSALTLMMVAVRPSRTDRGALRAWAIGLCIFSAVVSVVYLLQGPAAFYDLLDGGVATPCRDAIDNWWFEQGALNRTWHRFLFGGVGHAIFFCMLVPLLRGRGKRSAAEDMYWKLSHLWRVFRIYGAVTAIVTSIALVANAYREHFFNRDPPDFSFSTHFELYLLALQSALVSILMQPRVRAYVWLLSSVPALAFGRSRGWHTTAIRGSRSTRVTFMDQALDDLAKVAVPETWCEHPPGLGARVVLRPNRGVRAIAPATTDTTADETGCDGDETGCDGSATVCDAPLALGEGGFGAVFCVRLDDEWVAAKISRCEASSGLHALRREGLLMLSLGSEAHAHLCRCRGLCVIEGRPAILLDLHAGGTLSDALALESQRTPPAAPLAPLTQRWRLAPQLAAGLSHMHACGFLHLDIKASNVLLDAMLRHAVISDFGSAAVDPAAVDPDPSVLLPQAVCDEDARRELMAPPHDSHTFRYAAPELCFEHCPSKGADMYAFGHLLWELIHCERTFFGQKGMAVLIQRMAGEFAALPPWSVHPPPALARGYRYAHQADVEGAGGQTPAAAMEPGLWAEVVALVSDCWKLEAAARPDARGLERRLLAVADALPEPPASLPCVLQDCVAPPARGVPNRTLDMTTSDTHGVNGDHSNGKLSEHEHDLHVNTNTAKLGDAAAWVAA